jgi:hypothetical protein
MIFFAVAYHKKFREHNDRFHKTGSPKLPQPCREAEHNEYGQEHKGVTECPVCHNVHFQKSGIILLMR